MADPATLLALLTVGAALSGSSTRDRLIVSNDVYLTLPHTPTDMNLLVGRAPDTMLRPLVHSNIDEGQLQRAIRALQEHAAEENKAARDALGFLAAIPQYMQAPKAACGETGIVTLFWETADFYGDVEFRGDGKFSVFTRNRISKEDSVLDDCPIEDACGAWLGEYFGPLLPQSKHAEAA